MSFSHHKSDYVLLGIIGALVLFGLLILSSASAPLGYQKFGDPYYFVKHQLITGVLPGLIAFFILARLPYQKLQKLSFPLLIASIVLLTLVFIPGLQLEHGDSQSWINVFGWSFQPAEVVKLFFLIYLAAWLAGRGERRVQDLQTSFLPFVGALGLISLLMLLQPDLGTLFIIVSTALVVYFVGGGNLWHLGAITSAGFLGFLVLVKIAPYRMNRFTAFLNPQKDPQGFSYQLWQALIAVGSGGWLGVGLGHSRQKFSYLPEVTGDSIFAVIGEEIGFILCTVLIVLLLFLAYRGMRLSQQAPDKFSRLLVIGIISWIMIQSFINIAGILSLLPMTGVPLPFISAGGTSMMSLLAAAGILANISRQSKV